MAYATVQQVKEEFKSLPIDVNTAIKADQVSRFIEEAEALINAKISTKYQVPIVAPAALPLLRMLSISIVANRISSILQVKTNDDKTSQGSSTMSLSSVMDMLDKIVSGTIILSGGLPTDVTSGVRSFTSHNYVPKQFRRNVTQW